MKKYVLIILTAISISSYSQQLEVKISNMHYQNSSSINNCGEIDFQSNSNIILVFDIELKRPSSQATGDGTIYIYTKKNPAFGKIERASSPAPDSLWFNNTYTENNMTLEIYEDDYDISEGILYANYTTNSNASYDSCHYSIIKDEVPTFEISPTSTSVFCNSNSSKTFSVSNVYNSPGTIEYHWSVGNGWKRDGAEVSSFTTTTSNITLVPYQYPPSNVNVTPVLDGVSYDELTSNVSLSAFNPTTYTVAGASQLCSAATYSISNLPSNITVTSWSSSNDNVATISYNGNTAQLTAMGNGLVTISAVLTNSCGQTKTVEKVDIIVGNPEFMGSMQGLHNPLVGTSKWYTIAPAIGANNYEWYFDVGNQQTGTNIDGWEILQGQGTTNILVKIGNSGSTVIVCRASNNCGSRVGYKYVNSRTPFDPCDETIMFSSNPMQSGSGITNKFILINDPCDPWNNNEWNKANNPKSVNIYDNYGKVVYSKTQNEPKFTINKLEQGFYIVKYQTAKGKILTEKLIIN